MKKDLLMTIQYKDMGPFRFLFFNLKHIFLRYVFLQPKWGLKMPKREDINTVLVIGSGPIIIGPSM